MDNQIDRLKAALADRYAIERELGSGGMATVYLAEDVKHHRKVAIKVLRPELAASLGPKRFLREIEIAAKLTHPHVLPLYDSGEADGFLYYVMPFVEGETLAQRMQRENQLPLNDALRITREVADALAFAHSHDVVHRDIKPENILFEAGHAVIADFGIARAVTAAGEEELTATGLAVGTPAYMSPEQASAQQVDGRTDIYALGCVLYEMLAGNPPFTGSTPQAVLARHAVDPVPALRTVRAMVPDAVEAAIKQALAKVPADRFATAPEFAEALVSVPAAAPSRGPPEAAAAKQSIAVLAFTNMSADPENEYFSDGITEEIINALTHVPSLHVAARTSAFAFKGKNVNVRTVGEELNVGTVVAGSVRQAGNKLRITAQLINVADGYDLWSERYDREMSDVFAIQDDIAGAIVDALKVQLIGMPDAPLVRRGTEDLEAYHLYLKGRYFLYQRNLPKAIDYFEQAIAQNPNYALAHADIADAYCVLGFYGFLPSRDASAKASAAAERAIAADDRLAEAHHSRGLTAFYFGWDLQTAEHEFRCAIALNPRYAPAHAWLAWLLSLLGRFDEVRAEALRAQELEPLSPLISAVVGMGHFLSRQYDEAVEACLKGLEIDPNFGSTLGILGLPYVQQSRYANAITALEGSVAATNRAPLALIWLGGAYAEAGRTKDARRVLNELLERSNESYIPPVCFAWMQAYLGNMEQVFDWLERAVEERNVPVLLFVAWPGFEHVRSDPRFTALVHEAGLAALAAVWT